MILSSISLEQVEVLERTFATLTEAGWVIPAWLVYLRSEVESRDSSVETAVGVRLVEVRGP